MKTPYQKRAVEAVRHFAGMAYRCPNPLCKTQAFGPKYERCPTCGAPRKP